MKHKWLVAISYNLITGQNRFDLCPNHGRTFGLRRRAVGPKNPTLAIKGQVGAENFIYATEKVSG